MTTIGKVSHQHLIKDKTNIKMIILVQIINTLQIGSKNLTFNSANLHTMTKISLCEMMIYSAGSIQKILENYF